MQPTTLGLALCLFPAVGLLIPLAGLEAQAQPGQRARCFRGQPMPTCKSFWITEVGYS